MLPRREIMYETFDYIKMAEAYNNRIVWSLDCRKVVDMFWGLSTLLSDFGFENRIGRAVTRTLLNYMQDTNRVYHTPVHVISMFEWAEKHDIELTKAQQLAIWFHDAIYVPLRKDCELRSSLFMKALVGEAKTKDGIVDHVPVAQCIILSTRYHMMDVELLECQKLVMDLDLSHFAREEDVFLFTGQLVKEEFVPFVGEEEYEKGRRDFFNRLLSRESIFRTDLFKEKFEAKARENIEKFINST